MSDENERSVASAGSVAGEPSAWMHVSGGLSLGVFKHVDPRLRHLCVPLYRQPQNAVVQLPPLDPNGAPGWNAAIGAVREALANAGVDWDTE
jgi:hypothetical protein